VRYFVESNNVEIFDTKTNKLFLKKSECPATLSAADFFLGAKILLYGRHFELQDYLDPFTAERLGKQQQKAVLVVKRSMVARIGAILDALLRQQFAVAALKMLKVERAKGEAFFQSQRGANPAEFAALVDQLCSHPVIVIELVAESCSERLGQAVSSLTSRFGAQDRELDSSLSVPEAQQFREFFFETAHTPTATFQSCTCCVVLPHILKEGLAGEVIDAIQRSDAGVRISAMELFRLDRTTAAEFLEVYEGVVPHFHETVDHFTTGPCIAMELVGPDSESVVTSFRESAGPWDVEMAKELRPHTLRARYGQDRVRNALHCTDLPEDGVSECEYFFDILSRRQQRG
jgi:nucleoside-diphosphate kinase